MTQNVLAVNTPEDQWSVILIRKSKNVGFLELMVSETDLNEIKIENTHFYDQILLFLVVRNRNDLYSPLAGMLRVG